MAQDLKAVDDYLLTAYKDKPVSAKLHRNLETMATVALAIQSFDGGGIGKDLPQKVAWLEGKGAALVDLLCTRVHLFNRAVTRFLEDKDRPW
jgi:hypothetical protein